MFSRCNFGGAQPQEDTRTYTYDPDGRTATATTTTLGTMSYTYDLDGNKTIQTDPSNDAHQATITYTNYPDGLREYVSISGSQSLVKQTNALQYSYRQDGLLENETAGWGPNVTPGQFVWTYTPGGREVTETDPYDGSPPGNPPAKIGTIYYTDDKGDYDSGTVTLQPKTYTYDQFGRVKSLTLPEGYKADQYQYDLDDELTGRNTSTENTFGVMTANKWLQQYIVNARGELLVDATPCTTIACIRSANGTLVQSLNPIANTAPATDWDGRSGQAVQNQGNVFGYDDSGRQTSDVFTTSEGPQFTYNRTYDAENHIVQAPTGPPCNSNYPQTCTYQSATLSWGPDGQLRGICQSVQNPPAGSCDQSVDLHWDGSTLLFATTTLQGGTGQTVLYVGQTAVTYNGGGFMVADRNQNGIEETWHTGSAFGAWHGFSYSIIGSGRFGVSIWLATNWGSCYAGGYQYASCAIPPQAPASWDGLMVGFNRADGYTYASFAVQGVRTYDSTSQQWLTPDAYAGTVDDPMSQKPFVWNANDSLAWSDPTGFDPWPDSIEDFFDTEPVVPAGATVVSGGDYGNLTAYISKSSYASQQAGDPTDKIPTQVVVTGAQIGNGGAMTNFTYGVANLENQVLHSSPGNVYSLAEWVLSAGTINSNGVYAPVGQLVDNVGWDSPNAVPSGNHVITISQGFSVQYNGVPQNVNTVFTHVIVVTNGVVTSNTIVQTFP